MLFLILILYLIYVFLYIACQSIGRVIYPTLNERVIMPACLLGHSEAMLPAILISAFVYIISTTLFGMKKNPDILGCFNIEIMRILGELIYRCIRKLFYILAAVPLNLRNNSTAAVPFNLRNNNTAICRLN